MGEHQTFPIGSRLVQDRKVVSFSWSRLLLPEKDSLGNVFLQRNRLKKFPNSVYFGDKILLIEHLENLQPFQQ